MIYSIFFGEEVEFFWPLVNLMVDDYVLRGSVSQIYYKENFIVKF